MRAWRCHGRTQRELVDNLAQADIVRSPAVRAVMYAVDRKNYVPQRPHDDAPKALAGAKLSLPHTCMLTSWK